MRDEGGAGVIATTFGFTVFLAFLLLAVQVSLALYARSTASAIGFDLTRRAAAAGAGCGTAVADVPEELRARLGGWWRQVDVEASCDSEVATVRLSASQARSAAVWLRRPLGLDRLERRWVVRVERPR